MEARRYYCHQCSAEFPAIAQDFTCPTCNSGFVEELGSGNVGGEGSANEDLGGGLANDPALGPLMEALLPGLIGGPRADTAGRGRGGRGRTRIQISRGNPPIQNLGMDQAALENAIQDFVVNLAGMGFAGGGVGGMGPMHAMQMGGQPGGAQIHLVGPGFQIHGNPRDYAWGRGGLDTIITMLLNQVDGAGPPPMDRDNIQEIPTVKISEAQVVDNSSCSVCWEDFSVGEEVKQLECDHFFHGPCIVPWLELHGTCPVCRKVLNPAAAAASQAAPDQTSQSPDVGHAVPPPDLPSTDPPPSNPPPHSNAPGPPPRAVGGAEASAPGGGLTGLIVSALNQVFNYNSRSSQSPATGGGSLPVPATGGAVSSASESAPEDSSSGASGLNISSTSRPAVGNGTRDNDEETPASRRQRLDPDFVDFDLE